MPISLADLYFAVALKEMSDEDFLLAWHEEVVANEESRIIVVESAACPRGTTVTLVGFQARCAIASRRGSRATPLGGSDHRCCLLG
jgi:hypothetical protein